ncbi:transcriptional regulator antiterminator bglG/PRD-domain-containing protein [Lacticaseibacillus rhamnosus MTCC 5462]|nr:transcriptional regulator antiterminator bglG/PRD-domain-containing protein [Lacticaseibacillus rhamnosus MTCC 5462]
MSPLEAEIKLPVEVQKMIAQSQDPQAVQVIVSAVIQLAEQADIHFTAVQLQVLTNHLIEMINRSKSGEKLPAVDPQMFAEVSKSRWI